MLASTNIPLPGVVVLEEGEAQAFLGEKMRV